MKDHAKSPTIESLEAAAKIATKTKQWQRAIALWDSVLQQRPNRFLARHGKATALLKAGDLDQAEAIFSELPKTHPDRVQGLLGLTQIAIQRRQQQLVLQRCATLKEKFPQHPQGYFWQSRVLISLGELNEAETVLQAFIQQHPNHLQGHRSLAQVAVMRKMWDCALERFELIIEKFPQDVTGYVGKAKALNSIREFDAAEALLKKAVVKYPENISLLRALFEVASCKQQWDFPLDQLTKLVSDNPSLCSEMTDGDSFFKLLNDLIEKLLKRYEFEKVDALLIFLEKHSTASKRIVVWRSRLLHQQGDRQLAHEIATAALQNYPDYADFIYFQLAENAWKDFDLALVIAYCEKINTTDSDLLRDALIRHYKALIRVGRAKEAQAKLRQLIGAEPTRSAGYISLAEALYFGDQNYEQTLEVCEQAILQNVTSERVYVYRILALCSVGKTEQALRTFNQYLINFPHSRLVQIAGAQALRYANSSKESLDIINQWLTDEGFLPLESTGSHHELTVQHLRCNPGYRIHSGALVSVMMTTYQWNDMLPVAIASILQQTYRNLELIIIDDASPDDNFQRLQAIARTDSRIRLLRMAHNGGTYLAKNSGMAIAQGKYFSFMDSDDWLHPQALERQIELLQTPETLGVTHISFRIDENSNIEFKPEGPTEQAVVSLCFKRDPVFTRLGYFDAVRVSADAERLRRIYSVFGPQSVQQVMCPLLISTRHGRSLTGGGPLALAWYGRKTARSVYAAAYERWHAQIHQENLSPFIPYPLEHRPFETPEIMLP